MLWIYPKRLIRLRIRQPRQLHDRASRRAQNPLLYVLDVAADAVSLAAKERDLSALFHQISQVLVSPGTSELG